MTNSSRHATEGEQMAKGPLQPLRIPTGRLVSYNNAFYEIDPDPAVVPEQDRWWLFKQGAPLLTLRAGNSFCSCVEESLTA